MDKRIYEFARELSLSSKALMDILRNMGFKVKSHMSAVTPAMMAKIQERYLEERQAVDEEYQSKKQWRKKLTPKSPKNKVAVKTGKRKNGVPEKRAKIDERKLNETVRKTLARIETKRPIRKYKKLDEDKIDIIETAKTLELPETLTVRELSDKLEVDSTDVLKKCLELGIVVSINSRLDFDTMSLIGEDYGFRIIKSAGYIPEIVEQKQQEERKLFSRPPVITILGHVDHGKTTLLDYIRGSNLVAGEVGGITQRIGAYQVQSKHGKMTFIDTPGHYAFTSMRARGAQITDIAILVVAWDDGVMPQTIEAISHVRAAGVPIVIAINKMDTPGANPDKALNKLAEQDLLIEEWGGKTLCSFISAKTGMGVDKLLDLVALLAETLELKADNDAKATGVVIESILDRGRGVTATVLIRDGSLHKGDPIIVGTSSGRIRAMYNERFQEITEAPPSMPVVITGLNSLPHAGDRLMVTVDDKEAKGLADKRLNLSKENYSRIPTINLKNLKSKLEEGAIKELHIVLKADSDGTREAVRDLIEHLDFNEIKAKIVHSGIGDINESDVLLAETSQAIIMGFAVRADKGAKEFARKESVEIRLYKIIYELEDDLIAAMEGRLEPILVDSQIGVAEVRNIFKVSGTGFIAGSSVIDGVVKKGAFVKIKRDNEIIGEGKIANLKRFKDDVKEVNKGFECGIALENVPDIFEGDILQVYEKIETYRKLRNPVKP